MWEPRYGYGGDGRATLIATVSRGDLADASAAVPLGHPEWGRAKADRIGTAVALRLKCGGPDSVQNLQWQAVAAAKAKDRWEIKACGLRGKLARSD
jgi:hypothetical protein